MGNVTEIVSDRRIGVLPRQVEKRETVGPWQRAYARRLFGSDLVAVALAVFGVQLVWLGTHPPEVAGTGWLDYTTLSAILVTAWMVVLQVYGSRAPRVVGYGATEYRLILDGALRLFGVVAIVSYLSTLDISRGYILISFPLGVVLLLSSRLVWRRWLAREQRHHRMISRVILVAEDGTRDRVSAELAAHPEAGYVVVGVCTPDESPLFADDDRAVPVLGGVDRIDEVLAVTGADTVIVSGESGLSAERVRRLSWKLEGGRHHLIVAPNLTDIGGPRIHTRPVAGLPLVHIETPVYSGSQTVLKRSFDVVVSGALLVVLAPLFLVLAALVKLSGSGPVFYRQERIGLNGESFDMLKFRSMSRDADAQLAALLAAQGTGDTPLFKIDDDPRITPIGRVLRKYSLDELPQLLNVFTGSMSLVGPRPQREGEVALYDEAARRRLIVKPGMSGLWQVSGRSALSWEDAIRLDLFYVENWSLTGDIGILLRTFKAVVAPGETAH